MAALIKRGGHWNIKYRDASGKQVWRKGYTDKGETRDLANKLERDARAVKLGHVDPIAEHETADRAKTATHHIEQYEIHLRAAGCTDNHVSYTIADITKAFNHAGVKLVGQYNLDHLNAWVMTLTKDAPRTINRRVGSVRAFVNWCASKGIVSRFVLGKWKKRNVKGTEKRKCRHLLPAEVTALIKKTPSTERRDAYKFAVLTGLRYSELASMRPESFNLSKMTVTVAANDAKNKNKAQTIPLHPDLLKMVKARCKSKGVDDRIFTLPARTDAARLLRDDCEAAGVDTGRVMFHSLRHTFITRLAEGNIHPKILQGLARHSSLETTLQYYVHFRQADERAAVAELKAG